MKHVAPSLQLVFLIALFGFAASVFSAPLPACPSQNSNVYPPFSSVNVPPSVATWRGLKQLPVECRVTISNSADLTVAFASLFSYSGTINEIAARLGAVSLAKGLKYWSVTDRDWHVLIADAFALEAENHSKGRADFTDRELLSGQTLYFSQNDTRSWGKNTYSLQVVSASIDHLVVESRNVSPIRVGPIVIFEPGDTITVLFIDRLDDKIWRYFNLSIIQNSLLPVGENSVINRQAAFYRLLIGEIPDGDPALAP